MFSFFIDQLKLFFGKKEVLPRAQDLEFLAPKRVSVKPSHVLREKDTDNIAGIEHDNALELDPQMFKELERGLEKELEKVYKEENRNKYEKRKVSLLGKIDANIRQLHPISEELFEKGFKKYYDKIIELIEQSNSFARILRRLDVSKPYARELMATIKKQTMLVNDLIIKLYAE